MVPINSLGPDTDSNGAAGTRVVVDIEAEMVPRAHTSIRMTFICNLVHRSSSMETRLAAILFGLLY
jgi:hypothetical protein